MRVLTVQQPWAWAIIHGGKAIENRTQLWSYRGPLAIHAGARWSERGEQSDLIHLAFDRTYPSARQSIQSGCLPSYPFTMGAILGVVDLVDCHPDAGCCKPWGESAYVEHGGRTRRCSTTKTRPDQRNTLSVKSATQRYRHEITGGTMTTPAPSTCQSCLSNDPNKVGILRATGKACTNPFHCPSPEGHGNPFRYCPHCGWTEASSEKAGTVTAKGEPTKAEVAAVMQELHSSWNWLYTRPHDPALQRAAAGLSVAYQGLLDWCHERGVELDDDNLPVTADLT